MKTLALLAPMLLIGCYRYSGTQTLLTNAPSGYAPVGSTAGDAHIHAQGSTTPLGPPTDRSATSAATLAEFQGDLGTEFLVGPRGLRVRADVRVGSTSSSKARRIVTEERELDPTWASAYTVSAGPLYAFDLGEGLQFGIGLSAGITAAPSDRVGEERWTTHFSGGLGNRALSPREFKFALAGRLHATFRVELLHFLAIVISADASLLPSAQEEISGSGALSYSMAGNVRADVELTLDTFSFFTGAGLAGGEEIAPYLQMQVGFRLRLADGS